MGQLPQLNVGHTGRPAKVLQTQPCTTQKTPPVYALLDPNGSLLHNVGAKAELITITMQAHFSTHFHESIFEIGVRETLANQSAAPHVPITFFMHSNTRDVIRKLSNHRAPGLDCIPNCALKHCSRKAITHLWNIYNWCLSTE